MRSFTSPFSFFVLLLAFFYTSVSAIPISGQSQNELETRTTYMPAQAMDPTIVGQWIAENNRISDATKMVFYTGKGTFRNVPAFIKANPGYSWYDTIYGKPFKKAFGLSGQLDLNVIKAQSTAMAAAAEDTAVVMGADLAEAGSVWKQQELPTLKSSGKITKLISLSNTATSMTGADVYGSLEIADGVASVAADATDADVMASLLGDFMDLLFIAF